MKKALTKSKKGFTMIELIIVIAVIAILAGIAVPVISSVMRSSKLSVFESDSKTVEMMLSDALMQYEAGDKHTKYNNAPASLSTKVEDIMKANDLNDIEYSQKIGGVMYYMTWSNHKLKISNSPTNVITDSMTLYDLQTA